MALYSNTLLELVRMVLQTYLEPDSFFEGTATGGAATTTLADTSRYESDDFFQNTDPRSWLRIVKTTDGAAPVGQERPVSDWVQSTGTFTVAVAFSAATTIGDEYMVFNKYRWDEVKAALNMAILRATREGALIDKIDHSVVLVDGVYEYPLPAGFTHVYRVSMADANGQYPDPIPAGQWSIVRSTPQPRLRLERFPEARQAEGHWWGNFWADSDFVAGRNLRIEGFQKQAELVNVTDTCYIDPEFICNQAAAILVSKRIKRNDLDTDFYAGQFQVRQNTADVILTRPTFRPNLPPNTRRVQ